MGNTSYQVVSAVAKLLLLSIVTHTALFQHTPTEQLLFTSGILYCFKRKIDCQYCDTCGMDWLISYCLKMTKENSKIKMYLAVNISNVYSTLMMEKNYISISLSKYTDIVFLTLEAK